MLSAVAGTVVLLYVLYVALNLRKFKEVLSVRSVEPPGDLACTLESLQ